MRETIHIPIGLCGIQVFSSISSQLYRERGLTIDGFPDPTKTLASGLDSIFQPLSSGKHQIRCVLVDPDPESIVKYSESGLGQVPSVAGTETCGNNWAIGRYQAGESLKDSVLEAVRKAAEGCSSLDSLQFVHNIGGGSGSGVFSSLAESVKDLLPGAVLGSYTVLPSPTVSDVVVDPYNAVLGLRTVMEELAGVMLVDNEALMNISRVRYKNPTPCYQDLNNFVATYVTNAMTAWTCPSQIQWTYRKLLTSLVPFPSLKFLELSFAPLTCRCSCLPYLSQPEILERLFQREFALCASDSPPPAASRFMAGLMVFRGEVNEVRLEESPMDRYEREWAFGWAAGSLRTGKWETQPTGLKYGMGLIGNHTAVEGQFTRILGLEQAMHTRNAFMHWYTSQGMDEQELIDAEGKLEALISEYQSINSPALNPN